MSASRKMHPADLATIEAVKNAAYFTATIYVGGEHERHELKSLAYARAAAKLLPEARGVSRKGIVYAVNADGRYFMVPDDLIDPTTNPETHPMSAETTTIPADGSIPPFLKRVANAVADVGHAAQAVLTGAPAPEAPAAPTEGASLPRGIKAALTRVGSTAEPAPAGAIAANQAEAAIKAEADRRWRDWIASPKERKRPPLRTFVKRVRIERKAAALVALRNQKAMAAADVKVAAEKETDMSRKTQATTKSKARTKIESKAKTSGNSDRARYDWAGAEEKAKEGVMPKAPDFSAETHKRFRPLLAEVAKAATTANKGCSDAADIAQRIKTLKAIKVNPISTSPKAIDRFRKLCLIALAAKPARKSA